MFLGGDFVDRKEELLLTCEYTFRESNTGSFNEHPFSTEST